jgi:hypothetical protein
MPHDLIEFFDVCAVAGVVAGALVRGILRNL